MDRVERYSGAAKHGCGEWGGMVSRGGLRVEAQFEQSLHSGMREQTGKQLGRYGCFFLQSLRMQCVLLQRGWRARLATRAKELQTP